MVYYSKWLFNDSKAGNNYLTFSYLWFRFKKRSYPASYEKLIATIFKLLASIVATLVSCCDKKKINISNWMKRETSS